MASAQFDAGGFFQKRIRLIYILIAAIILIALGGWREYSHLEEVKQSRLALPVQKDCPPSPAVQYRMNEYKFTHPLLLGDGRKESDEFAGLKNEVSSFIQSKIQTGQILNASVYLRRFKDGNWMGINDDETYSPGSLVKVPIMMTYLREAEQKPGLLNKEIYYSGAGGVPHQTFNAETIQPGKKYTIRQLLYYMVAKSDNNATLLLNQEVDQPMVIKLFTDLGLPEPDLHSKNYGITASGYSKFLRMLYNAAYISNDDAEFALSMLTESTFTQGLMEGIPTGIKVAHKFGEMGEVVTGMPHQLHESGIVFLNDDPYLLTVMTRGNDVKLLPEVIAEVSKRVYGSMVLAKKNS